MTTRKTQWMQTMEWRLLGSFGLICAKKDQEVLPNGLVHGFTRKIPNMGSSN
jgi:hypothetical protein